MSDIKKIMVGLAFSSHSRAIFLYAANLARALDAELFVANVINIRDVEAVSSVESMGYNIDTEAYLKGLKEDRLSQLEEITADSPVPKKKMKTLIDVGHPFETLLKIIKEEGVDLAVIGTRERTDLEYILIGSVADKMIRHCPIPVVSFRKKN